ncbi:MAG: oxygen-independent coproporphyrinogen III oxidase [Candidatus Latescibacterota bacterium]
MPDHHISAELLQRYDRPGPRYTSYPTAVEFHEGFTARDYVARLRGLTPEQPLSLYIHLPFCQHRCTFCGCNVIITPRREVAAAYLEKLERELDLLCRELPPRPGVLQYHWGGGTPTYYAPEQLHWLHERVAERFRLLPGAEIAVEVDPRVTSREHIDLLAELGFNRLSMGVQDFTPQVQEAIGRNQDEESTRRLYEYCRQKRIESLNIDLIYGLPQQEPESFARNLASVLLLRPDRVALYSYAHVPWIKGHQKRIDVARLPRGMAKLELFAQAIRAFLASGYAQIGMDHFALPDDELCHAMAERRLHRNFMGYTVHRTANMIGLGISAIGDVAGAYAQNVKKLSTYYRALDAGEMPVERGYALSADDHVRRSVITELMCNAFLRWADVEERFGIRFADYFALELKELASGPVADGLLVIRDGELEATDQGRLFIRNIAMTFDRYLREKQRDTPTFSRTV